MVLCHLIALLAENNLSKFPSRELDRVAHNLDLCNLPQAPGRFNINQSAKHKPGA